DHFPARTGAARPGPHPPLRPVLQVPDGPDHRGAVPPVDGRGPLRALARQAAFCLPPRKGNLPAEADFSRGRVPYRCPEKGLSLWAPSNALEGCEKVDVITLLGGR